MQKKKAEMQKKGRNAKKKMQKKAGEVYLIFSSYFFFGKNTIPAEFYRQNSI